MHSCARTTRSSQMTLGGLASQILSTIYYLSSTGLTSLDYLPLLLSISGFCFEIFFPCWLLFLWFRALFVERFVCLTLIRLVTVETISEEKLHTVTEQSIVLIRATNLEPRHGRVRDAGEVAL